MQFTIRKVTLDDYEGVRILEELEFDLHKKERPDYFKDVTQSYFKEELIELLEEACPIPWVAVQEGRIVGICFGKIGMTRESEIYKGRKVAFLQDIAVLPQCRRQGVATALLEKAWQQIHQERVESFELCVWKFNERAWRFYEKLGMRVQYARMELPLTPAEED